jgi:hypothetical protein
LEMRPAGPATAAQRHHWLSMLHHRRHKQPRHVVDEEQKDRAHNTPGIACSRGVAVVDIHRFCCIGEGAS